MKISLNTIEKVKQFVEVASCFEDPIDLSVGRFMVDGKSILGIFSLDLREPLEVVTYGGREEAEILMAVRMFAA